MKIITRFLISTLLVSSLLIACQKEYSFEDKGGSVIIGGGTSEGTIGGASGPCTNSLLAGILGAGIALNDSNQLVVEMNFTRIGTYFISTDTVNGFYFSRSGTITATGATQVVLYGRGTPIAPGDYSFKVTYKGSFCSTILTVYDIASPNGPDYFPTTAGSSWHYISSNPSASPGDTVLTIANPASFTIANNIYRLFTNENDAGADSLFYRKGNGDYHEFGDMDVAGVASNFVYADYIFLKDNVDAGTGWETAEGDAIINGDTVKIKLKFVITEKNVTVQLNNLVYKNVIKVQTTEQVKLATGWNDVISYETWFAQGIGVINVVAPAPVYGFHVTKFSVK